MSASQSIQVSIAASFSIEPIQHPLQRLFQRLSVTASLRFCPSNQLFQSLLSSSSSPLFDPRSVANLVFVRLEDFLESSNPGDLQPGSTRKSTIEEFVRLVRTAASQTHARFLICLCPDSPQKVHDPGVGARLHAAGLALREALESSREIILFNSSDLPGFELLEDPADPISDQLAQIPYKPGFFDFLAVGAVRKLHALLAPPRKLIVLDCDGTLWDGVVAEDGALNVKIDEPRGILQKFFLSQVQSGRLLALCSRNQEEDVLRVLDEHPAMRIRRSDISIHRINWDSKASNLVSMARSLNFALSTLVFIDDDPVQCAAVQSELPEVLTLQLPSDPVDALAFLKQVWDLDPPATTTNEDARRAGFVSEESSRQQVKSAAPTLEEFLAGLNLQIRFSELEPGHFERVIQLSLRTTQFNCSNSKPVHASLADCLSKPGNGGCVVHVSDRFGDYGLVGVLLYRFSPPELVVESFMLSCRALGRGVEQEMVRHLTGLARLAGSSRISFEFKFTSRNTPARVFLESFERSSFNGIPGERGFFLIPTETACNPPSPQVVQAALSRSSGQGGNPSTPPPPSASAPSGGLFQMDGGLAHQIAGDFLKQFARPKRTAADEQSAPISEGGSQSEQMERALISIWKDLMDLESVGIHDNFFELGGHSITVIQCVSRVRDQFGIELPITAIFEAPTIAELSVVALSLGGAAGRSATTPKPVEASPPESEGIAPANSRREILSSPVMPAPIAWTAQNSAEADGITTLAIPTRDRPDALQRGIPGFVENARKHGRKLRFLIVDDSLTSESQLVCQQTIQNLGKQLELEFAYVDMPARETFAGHLNKQTGVPLEIIRFGLINTVNASYARGACVNAMLLATTGEQLLSVDDDVVCSPSLPPDATEMLGYSGPENPEEFWFYRSMEEASRSQRTSQIDFVGRVGEFLGKTSIELVHGKLHAIPSTALASPGRVLLTTPGIVGDPGWNLPFGWWDGPMGYLMLNGKSHERLVSNDEDYLAFSQSRALARCAQNPNLDRFAGHLTTTVGMDNRFEGLPPFPPILRGEDVLFGAVLRRCQPESWGMHLPWMTFHAQMKPRTFQHGELFRSASSHDWSRLLLDCIGADPMAGKGSTAHSRLVSLGRFLVGLEALPIDEFIQFSVQQAIQSRSRWLARMQERLASPGNQAGFWVADMQRYISVCENYLTDPMFGVPLDLMNSGMDPNLAWKSAQELVGKYGSLLLHWPQLVEGTVALKRQGVELARPLAASR